MRTLLFLLMLSVLPFRSHSDVGCDYALRSDVEIEDLLRGPDRSERVINITDRRDSAYFGHATLNKGVMIFTVKTRDERGESAVLNAEESFQFLFSRLSPQVQEIHCIWRWGDSHKEFNRLTGEGMDPETAVKMTWEAKQALSVGYTDFEIVRTYGTPGKYRDVEVTFRKPKN